MTLFGSQVRDLMRRRHWDTLMIAEHLRVPESDVWNALARSDPPVPLRDTQRAKLLSAAHYHAKKTGGDVDQILVAWGASPRRTTIQDGDAA
jgi:hypothetical protein